MAFDAAAAGQRPPRSRASSGVASGADGRGGDGGNELKQRVWTLMQTGKSIESMTGALGTANDTTLLRSKLVAEETTAASLINEIDSGIRKMRVATMRDQDRDSSAARALDRLNDQYNEVRKRVVDAVRLSQQRQRQYVPTEVPMPPPKQQQQQRKASPTQDLPNPFGGQQPGSYDSSSSSQPQVVLEMRRLGDVEDTIARVRGVWATCLSVFIDAVLHRGTVAALLMKRYRLRCHTVRTGPSESAANILPCGCRPPLTHQSSVR